MSLAAPARRAEEGGPPSPASTCGALSPGPDAGPAACPGPPAACPGVDIGPPDVPPRPADENEVGSLPSTWSQADGMRPGPGDDPNEGEALRMACQLRRVGASSSTLSTGTGEESDCDSVSSCGSWQPVSTLRSYLYTPATNPALSRPTSAWTTRSERMFTPFTCRSSRSPSMASEDRGPLVDTRWSTTMYAHNLSAGGWRHLGKAPIIAGQPTGWQKMKAWVSASPVLVFILLPLTLKSKIATRLHKKLCKGQGITWERDRKVCRCGNQMAWGSDYGRTHCRSCGVCVCHACVTKQHLPELGFDEPVSICHECSISRIPLDYAPEKDAGQGDWSMAHQECGQMRAEDAATSEAQAAAL